MRTSSFAGQRKSRQKANPYRALLLLAQPGAQLVTLEDEQGALILLGKRSTRVNQATLDVLREQRWIEEQPATILEGALSSQGRLQVQQWEARRRGYTQLPLPDPAPA